MVGRALGLVAAFVAFVTIAAAYGSSIETDIYFCAYAVPYAFLVVAGAVLPQSFVPVYAKVAKSEGEASARRFASASLNATTLALTALALVGILAAPGLARLAAPGLHPDHVAEVGRQLRWLMALVVFGGVANLAKGILTARFVFFTPSLDTFASYALVIAAVWIGAGRWGIWALVAGTLLGNLFRLAVMAPDLARVGWRPVLSHPRLRTWGATLVPLAAGAIVFGANFVLMRSLASLAVEPHSVSHLGYAERLVMVPSELVAASLGAALLPAAAARHAAGERAEFARVTSSAVRASLLFLIPAAAGVMALSEPLVRLVYEHGEFGRAAAKETASTLFWFAPILPGSTVLIVGQALFAMGKVRAVVAMWCVITGLTLAIGWALLGPMGVRGVALAYAAATVFAGVGGLVALARSSKLRLGDVGKSAARMVASAGVMAALVTGGRALFESSGWGTGKIETGIEVAMLGFFGAAAYAVLMGLLGAPEWAEARRRL
jgi:putative peptidoglycan lipid II flippase